MPDTTARLKPLEKRTYKFKKPTKRFFCPLCRTQRVFLYRSNLSLIHYLQIVVASMFIFILIFPSMGYKALSSVFIVWALFEFVYRTLFRKEIPCPHCGFDASWYKRDIRVAKRLVKEFWEKESKQNNGQAPGNDSVVSEIIPISGEVSTPESSPISVTA